MKPTRRQMLKVAGAAATAAALPVINPQPGMVTLDLGMPPIARGGDVVVYDRDGNRTFATDFAADAAAYWIGWL